MEKFILSKIIGLLFIGIIVVSSCKKEVDLDNNPIFIGEWYTNMGHNSGYGSTLLIKENGDAIYSEFHGFYYHNGFSGKARTNGTTITIDRIYNFNIIEQPTRVDTNKTYIVQSWFYMHEPACWMMKVEGPLIWAASGVYYKRE